MKVFIAFVDSSQAAISSVFSCAQDVSVWPNQAELDTSDTRYSDYFNSLNPVMQNGLVKPNS
jgi:hypothetical protein